MKEEREHIFEEIKELAPRLAAMDHGNPFCVPDNYFQQLEFGILERIRDFSSEKNISINQFAGNEENMEVPDGYFNSLQDKVLSQIAHEEIESLPVRLLSLKGTNPFKVPHEYFEQLTDQVLSGVYRRSGKVTARIYRLLSPKFGLVAAALTGIVLTVFLFQDPKSTLEVADINHEDVIEYLVDHIDEFGEDELIPLVNEEQLGENLMDVLDDDIQQYLNDEEIDLDMNEIL